MMKKALFSAIVALAMTVSLPCWAGKIITDNIESQVLGATVQYNVYLPDGFDNSAQTYPVVYLLHGLSDTYTAWQEKGRMDWVADELIISGEAVPMVVIMPNAGGPDVRNTWNGYFNMPGWNYEDFFFQELLPQAEAKYRCGGDKGHRAVMGLSMGGGGSTVYSQRHPDMFSSCYAMSAWLSSDEGEPADASNKAAVVSYAVNKHSALRFVEQADEATKEQLRTVKWFFDCGDDDFLFDLNVRMHQLMRNAGIKDELRVRDGVHNWEYWHEALRTALPFASRNFSK